ncbi:MAG: alpha/beta fold hydrolase [Opitutales bacterium]
MKLKHSLLGILSFIATATLTSASDAENPVHYHTEQIDGVDIFYREAGNPENPAILLLHGFPTSSHMFRNLIQDLKDDFYLIAPDYPGFGNSAQPDIGSFEYSFDNFAQIVNQLIERIGIERYSLYLMDYGAPVGFRIATAHPERVETLIVQNGNAYAEGLREFWDPIRTYWANPSTETAAPLAFAYSPEGVKWQYTDGTRNPSAISPDNWVNDRAHLDRNGNEEIQLKLFLDYATNLDLYPKWQAFMREHQPPTLITWGKNDYIFPVEGAHPYKQDLKTLEFHLLDTGHFALEEDGEFIAGLIGDFIPKYTKR